MRLRPVHVSGAISAWESLGFVSHTDIGDASSGHRIVVPGLVLVFHEVESESHGLTAWDFSADPHDRLVEARRTSIDGIPTTIHPAGPISEPDRHRLDIVGVDHVVVMTGSLDRTCSAITAAVGEPLRRVRDAGRGIRQGFHRAGDVIIEVVERPDLVSTDGASLWGLVFNVRDLDESVEWLGPDAVSSPRDAVQPGRRIATLRAEAGLGVPVALMTPAQPR
jgi:hypothetical protein